MTKDSENPSFFRRIRYPIAATVAAVGAILSTVQPPEVYSCTISIVPHVQNVVSGSQELEDAIATTQEVIGASSYLQDLASKTHVSGDPLLVDHIRGVDSRDGAVILGTNKAKQDVRAKCTELYPSWGDYLSYRAKSDWGLRARLTNGQQPFVGFFGRMVIYSHLSNN